MAWQSHFKKHDTAPRIYFERQFVARSCADIGITPSHSTVIHHKRASRYVVLGEISHSPFTTYIFLSSWQIHQLALYYIQQQLIGKDILNNCLHYNRLSRKRLEIIYRLIAVPQAHFVSGVKVSDRPIGYFFGEACHDFSLREQAKGRNTTQRRAGLPVRNRIG